MALMASASLDPVVRPGVLFAIVLSGVIGFVLGQSWPLGTLADANSIVVPEDWHGNVRRSYGKN